MKEEKGYDVVIIGSGGAGLRAAIGALDGGASVMLISKGKANRSGSSLLAGANISADLACEGASLYEMGITSADPGDTREKWFEDVIYEGFYLNNQKMVELFVNTAADRIKELVSWGMKIRGIEGGREISVFGSDILDSLFGAFKQKGGSWVEDTMMMDLVTEGGEVKGVLCLDIKSGEPIFYPAKAVVLATGGSHNLFSMNSGPTDLWGEGPGSALKAGAPLVDMEFISFCPTVMLKPHAYKGNILPYIFQTLGYAQLKNCKGLTFTSRYLSGETEELALFSEWNKMLLSYVIQREIEAGGGATGGGIYQEINSSFAQIKEEMYGDLPSLSKGIYADLMKIPERGEAFVISPAAHYFEGGIMVDETMATGVKGLYAAGECTGGLFGANRVSAATTEMLIEGAAAGASAAAFVKSLNWKAPSSGLVDSLLEPCLAPFTVKEGPSVFEIKRELQEINDRSLWVIRREKELQEALEKLKELEEKIDGVKFANPEQAYNAELILYLQLRNGIHTAGATAKSALMRKESRGVHVRADYGDTDNGEYLKNGIILDTDLRHEWKGVEGQKYLPHWKKLPYMEGIEETSAQLNGE